jgi:HD-GYP domain-containing protein (c-di-GMP phosphodiesterase class II)
MVAKLSGWFKFPISDSIEQTQKAQFLYITLLVTIGTSLLIGIQNVQGDTYIGIALFVLAAICFLCIPLSNRGYYVPVAAFISLLVLTVITLSLLEGIGMRDSGLLGYPVLIIFTSFLFNKEITIISTIVSLASIELVYYLERTGYLVIPAFDIDMQLVVVSVLVMAAGLAMWFYKDNWERILRDLRGTYDLTLSGWGQALELRDHETEGHSQRAVELTVSIGRRLELTRRELEHIRRGALLHDIGKMAIPDAILLKPGRLTAAEWRVIRQHPQQAVRMLERIPTSGRPWPSRAATTSAGTVPATRKDWRAKPSRWAARIFAVVDVWDALISDRPYRKAWTERRAREYIQRNAGRLFDPRVVEEFLKSVGNTV